MIGNISERMDLDGKLSQLKTSIGSCKMHNSQYLEDTSIFTAIIEPRAYVYDAENISSESLDAIYSTILNDDSVTDGILVAGTTYYKSKKDSKTAKKLSKI